MFKLIPEWKKAHRMISVQCMTIATAMLSAWGSMPDKFQQAIPVKWVIIIAAGLLITGTVGRLVQQKKVRTVKAEDQTNADC